MRQGRQARSAWTRTLRLCAYSIVCALLLLSCSSNDSPSAFSQALTRIDVMISSGESIRAGKLLASLRSRAGSVREWLSIAKRQRSLDDFKGASVTLRKALKKIPLNIDLTAVLADTLIQADQLPEARKFSVILSNSVYSATAALAEIKFAMRVNPYLTDPLYWKAAFSATNNPSFSRNAAVLYAYAGNYLEACSQAVAGTALVNGAAGSFTSDDPYFYALLCYDAGFFERVFFYLPRADLSARSVNELVLMADTAISFNIPDTASFFWKALIDKNQSFSPLPYYNLSVVAASPAEKTEYLETCLSFFPAYYPAVVRYIRSVPVSASVSAADPISGELEAAGFYTLDMEEKMRERSPDAEKARRVLDVALGMAEGSPDTRLLIEDFRYTQLRDMDTIRSSSAMWKLLEKSPGDSVLHAYAVWYFASIGNFDSCFALNGGSMTVDGACYTGLEASFAGDLARAEEAFNQAANNEQDAWSALANLARIHGVRHMYETAVEELVTAAGLAPDDRIKSRLHYETARILLEMNSGERAENELKYALNLDPSNYLAAQLLHEMEAYK